MLRSWQHENACQENKMLRLWYAEDQSRARIGNAVENLSRVRRLALTLLKQETTAKVGIKAKRLMAGWDEKCLLRVLRI
jgi:predicted transposase YbfD/YdcC